MQNADNTNHAVPGRRRFLAMTAGLATAAGGAAVAVRPAAAAGKGPRSHSRSAGLTGTVVLASSYGFDPADSTLALQAALDDTAADVVVIDAQASDWVTGPLRVNRDNLTIVVEPGVTVRAKTGAYASAGATLLTINGRNGITVSGYQAQFVMNKAEYIAIGDNSQWRHAVNIASSTNVTVEGLAISGSGGDGVYVGRVQAVGYLAQSQNVVLRDLRCDDNFRNALSVVSVDGLLVEGCHFLNTGPQNPGAGIDLEPNKPDEKLNGIVIRDCLIDGNERFAFLVARALHTNSPNPIDVTVERVAVLGGSVDFGRFTYYAPVNGTDSGGTIDVRDSYLEAAPYAGAFVFVAKPSTGAAVAFSNVVAHSLGQPVVGYQPIALLALTVVDHGGIAFDDVLLRTDVTGSVFEVQKERGIGAGLQDITGTITIESPTTPIMNYGANPAGATWTVNHVTSLAAPQVTATCSSGNVTAGQPVTVTVSRTGSTAAPLAVHYSLGGTALERVDYQGLPGTVVIPAGAANVAITIRTRCRGGVPATETAALTIATDPHYTVGGAAATFGIIHTASCI